MSAYRVIAAALLLAAFPQIAHAQSCGDRRERMKVYLAEADTAHKRVAELKAVQSMGASALADRRLEDLKAIDRLKGEKGHEQDLKSARDDRDYINALLTSRQAGKPPPSFPVLVYWEARQDELATNISHSRAAMDSMHCEEATEKQPDWAGGMGGEGGSPSPASSGGNPNYAPGGITRELSDNNPQGWAKSAPFCCQMEDKAMQSFSCSEMTEPERCTTNKGKIVKGGSCNMGTCTGGK